MSGGGGDIARVFVLFCFEELSSASPPGALSRELDWGGTART